MASKTKVVYYAEGNDPPALNWLADQPDKVIEKFRVLIGMLEEQGSRLSRPYAAPLRDKIYELRAKHQQVNYRILYAFYAGGIAVLAHGCTKEREVDDADIDRAIERRKWFASDPATYTYVDDEGS